MGAVPVQDAKCALLGKRVMSPTSISSLAASGGADAVQIHERGPGGFQELGEFLVRGLLPGVDPLEVTDEFRGNPAAGLACGITWTNPGEKGFRLCGGQILLRPAWDEFQQ